MDWDFLCRGTLPELETRFCVMSCVDACNDAVLAHNLEPVAAHLLCRAVGAGVLISPLLSEEEHFTVRWEYVGKVKALLADVDADANIRALISPGQIGQVDSLEALFGDAGTISIVRAHGPTGRIVSSSTGEAPLHDVVEDLGHLFAVSDQIETAMAVLVQFAPDPSRPVRQCYGVLLQALPDCDLEQFDALRRRLQSPEVRTLLENGEQDGDFANALLRALTRGLECQWTLHAGSAPAFRCRCSQESSVDMLRTLPAAERAEIRQRNDVLRVRCHFCSKSYEINPDEIPA